MRKKLLLFIGILLIFLIGYSIYLFNKPHSSIANVTPSVSIAAIELYKGYVADEKRGDTKYLNKIIEINGIVNDVQKTDSSLSIFFKADEMNGVNCSVSLNDNKKNLLPKKGDTIFLKGICTGFIMDVELNDCVIENKLK